MRLKFGAFFLTAIAGMLATACDDTPRPPTTASTHPKPAEQVVDVAANLPLTGALAVYGTEVRDGAELAEEQLDRPDDGVDLHFDWQDNASEAPRAVTVAQQQLLSGPDVYVSGVKPQFMAVAPLVQQRGLPHFVWVFDAYINADNAARNHFRTWVGYRYEPDVYLGYAKKREAKRVAAAYVELPHTDEEFNKLVAPGVQNLGASVALYPYPFGKTDFKDLAARLKADKPDLIVLNGFQGELVSQVRALRAQGLVEDGNVIATYDLMDAAQILAPEEMEGLRVVVPRFLLEPSAQTTAFRKAFEARYNRTALYTAAYAYDMVATIRDAARRVGPASSLDEWRSAILATKLDGVTGPLSFSEDGDLLTPLAVGVYRGGRLVLDQ